METNMQDDEFWEGGSPIACDVSQTSQDVGLELKGFLYTFETCQALWNPNDTNYMNKRKRDEELDRLLVIYKKIKPNATRDDVKKKINSLRSNYRKELKKIEVSKRSGSGADSIYKPKSSTFYYLHFLSKIEKPLLNKEDDSGDHQESLVFSSIMTDDCPPPKMTKKTNDKKTSDLLDKACDLLSQPSFSSQPTVNPLALVWTEKLALLTPIQRLYAEKAINDVLFEAQLNNLRRDSVQINSFVPTSSPAQSRPYPYTPSPVNIHIPENSNSAIATQIISKPNEEQSSSKACIEVVKGLASEILIQRPQQMYVVDTSDYNSQEYCVGDLFAQFKPS